MRLDIDLPARGLLFLQDIVDGGGVSGDVFSLPQIVNTMALIAWGGVVEQLAQPAVSVDCLSERLKGPHSRGTTLDITLITHASSSSELHPLSATTAISQRSLGKQEGPLAVRDKIRFDSLGSAIKSSVYARDIVARHSCRVSSRLLSWTACGRRMLS